MIKKVLLLLGLCFVLSVAHAQREEVLQIIKDILEKKQKELPILLSNPIWLDELILSGDTAISISISYEVDKDQLVGSLDDDSEEKKEDIRLFRK